MQTAVVMSRRVNEEGKRERYHARVVTKKKETKKLKRKIKIYTNVDNTMLEKRMMRVCNVLNKYIKLDGGRSRVS